MENGRSSAGIGKGVYYSRRVCLGRTLKEEIENERRERRRS